MFFSGASFECEDQFRSEPLRDAPFSYNKMRLLSVVYFFQESESGEIIVTPEQYAKKGVSFNRGLAASTAAFLCGKVVVKSV